MKRAMMPLLALLLAITSCGGAFADMPEQTYTASDLVDFAYAQLGEGYIYGGYGQLCDKSFRYGRAGLYPEYAGLILNFGAQWDGHRVYDCIGLFKAFAIQGGMPIADLKDVNVTRAYERWVTEYGPLEGVALQPGMVMLRMEGSRNNMPHIGVYVGNGKVIHARGTRWGVVMDDVPGTFTHWAKFDWITYDLPLEDAIYTDEPWLAPGEFAVIDTDDESAAPVFALPPESGKRAQSFSSFSFGSVVSVVEVPDEMSRLVAGFDMRGEAVIGYVRLMALSAWNEENAEAAGGSARQPMFRIVDP